MGRSVIEEAPPLMASWTYYEVHLIIFPLLLLLFFSMRSQKVLQPDADVFVIQIEVLIHVSTFIRACFEVALTARIQQWQNDASRSSWAIIVLCRSNH